jgi:hypothetical protein
MENEKEHHELMTALAVFQATANGKFDSIINHLATLNGQTAKNTGAIDELQKETRDIRSMAYFQGNQQQEERERLEKREDKKNGWKKQWQEVFFGTVKWIVPALIVGLLSNGKEILQFLGLSR